MLAMSRAMCCDGCPAPQLHPPGDPTPSRRDIRGPETEDPVRAVLVNAFGENPRLAEVPEPECPPRGAVIRVRATGVCRSDWHAWMGHDDDVMLPHVPGTSSPARSPSSAPRSIPTRAGRSATASPRRSSAPAAGAPSAVRATSRSATRSRSRASRTGARSPSTSSSTRRPSTSSACPTRSASSRRRRSDAASPPRTARSCRAAGSPRASRSRCTDAAASASRRS